MTSTLGRPILILSVGLLLSAVSGASGKTLKGSCDKNGNCVTPTTGVKPQATLRCSSASGANPQQNLTACSVNCVPNCGNYILKQGDDALIPNGGTITLICSGQAPTSCTLTITEPKAK